MIDMHTHSTWSDGTLSPEELVDLAACLGLEAVALCDHNTVAGLPDFLNAAENAGLWAVPGVEFSSDYRGTELHILALFVKPEVYPAINAFLEQMLIRKERSNRDLVSALNQEGFSLDYEAIKASTPNGQVNRAVIAAEMVRKGYCDSVKDAFSQWLSQKRGFYTPPKRPDVFQVISLIRSLGCVSVLAHPFLNLNEAGLREFLPEAVNKGLNAIEVYYSEFREAVTALAADLAEEYGLLKSGGSDFHGDNKPDIALGTGHGNLNIPRSVLENLLQALHDQ